MKTKTNDWAVLWIVIIILAATLLFLLFNTSENQKNDVIKIGVIEAFSGDGAIYGEWTRKNVLIAAEEINNRGGLNNKKIELIFEDHKALPQEAISAYQKLKFEDVSIILVGWSSPTLAIAPLANKDKKILITHSATTPLYSIKDDYTFRTAINARQFAKEEAEFLFNELEKKKVAVIYINNDFGLGMKTVFIEHFENLGGEVLIIDNFEQGSKDFRDIITKVKKENPEAIFHVGQLVESGMLIKQMKELNLDTQVISDVYTIEGSDFLDGAGDSGEGIIYVAPYFDKNKKPDFYQKYKEKFGEDPNYYAQAYDALMVIEEAMKNCEDEYNTDCIKDELFKIQEFEGASGTLSFDEYGDVEKPVTFKIIRDGKFVEL